MEWIKLAGTGMILAASLWTGLHAALRLKRTYEELRDLLAALALEGSCPGSDAEGRTRRLCAEAGLVLPSSALLPLERLFDEFGRFDRAGQLRQLGLASAELTRLTDELSGQLGSRCRTYALLGLSAGAAVLVLVI